MAMIPAQLKSALFAQIFYVGLVISWQLVGVALEMTGRPAQGPTTSLSLAGQAVVLAILYVVALRRSPALFAAMSLVAGIVIWLHIQNALTADPTLWSSEAARYLSIAINSVGMAAAALAVVGYVRWRRAGVPAPDPRA